MVLVSVNTSGFWGDDLNLRVKTVNTWTPFSGFFSIYITSRNTPKKCSQCSRCSHLNLKRGSGAETEPERCSQGRNGPQRWCEP